MQARIELLSHRLNGLQAPVLVQCGKKLVLGHLKALDQRIDVTAVLCCSKSALHVVQKSENVPDQALIGELHCLFLVTDKALTVILKLSLTPEHLVLQLCVRSLKFSDLCLKDLLLGDLLGLILLDFFLGVLLGNLFLCQDFLLEILLFIFLMFAHSIPSVCRFKLQMSL